MVTDFPTIDEMKTRIERVLRGEDISRPAVEAGTIPTYYGAEHPYYAWMRMWRRMSPRDEAFYQAGAIGWGSR